MKSNHRLIFVMRMPVSLRVTVPSETCPRYSGKATNLYFVCQDEFFADVPANEKTSLSHKKTICCKVNTWVIANSTAIK